MTKADMALLEKAFAKEITGWPLQTKSKRAKTLVERGYLQFVQRVDRIQQFPMHYDGYELTEKGRMAYCEMCREVEHDTKP